MGRDEKNFAILQFCQPVFSSAAQVLCRNIQKNNRKIHNIKKIMNNSMI